MEDGIGLKNILEGEENKSLFNLDYQMKEKISRIDVLKSLKCERIDAHRIKIDDFDTKIPENIADAIAREDSARVDKDLKLEGLYSISDDSESDSIAMLSDDSDVEETSISGNDDEKISEVGLHVEYTYARSLARFAANLGPIGGNWLPNGSRRHLISAHCYRQPPFLLPQHLQMSQQHQEMINAQKSLNKSVTSRLLQLQLLQLLWTDFPILMRTAICKANKGSFKDAHPEDLLAPVLKALLEKTKLNPNEVGDIVVGNVLAPGSQRAIECRMAAFYAGFPETVPLKIVNRQCSSGLQAVADVAAAIKAGYYDVGIGAGLESMTLNKMGWEGPPNPKAKYLQQVQDCYLPMGVTSENVAERYGITKEEQDQAAVISHKRAAAAIASGKFKEEIVPVTTKIVDPKSGVEKEITVSMDEGVRPDTSLSGLAKLKPTFKKGGSTTAGNASQVSDGAGAVLLMRRDVAIRKGLPIHGIFRSFVAIGVDPAVMGIGPAVAIPAAVRAVGLQIKDIDLYEINEAFASQYVYCIKELGLDPDKVNVNGGAIALGHPLGATGARCVSTLLNEMKRRGNDCRFGIISMCIGSGMGAAAVFERGDAVDHLSNVQITHS